MGHSLGHIEANYQEDGCFTIKKLGLNRRSIGTYYNMIQLIT
jgi:hypothetical protein